MYHAPTVYTPPRRTHPTIPVRRTAKAWLEVTEYSRGKSSAGFTFSVANSPECSVWVRLRLAYRVAQVGNAGAPDHRRVAKDHWRAVEAVEQSNSGAKENR